MDVKVFHYLKYVENFYQFVPAASGNFAESYLLLYKIFN
jgi:hypothetical protein